MSENCDHLQWKTAPGGFDDDGEWQAGEEVQISSLKELDLGRLKCTLCDEVVYYTGSWQNFYERGIPCTGSHLVNRDKQHDHQLQHHGFQRGQPIKNVSKGESKMPISHKGLVKLMEECGEVIQVAAKLVECETNPNFDTKEALMLRLEEEIADANAAMLFVVKDTMNLSMNRIRDRCVEKRNKYNEWHAEWHAEALKTTIQAVAKQFAGRPSAPGGLFGKDHIHDAVNVVAEVLLAEIARADAAEKKLNAIAEANTHLNESAKKIIAENETLRKRLRDFQTTASNQMEHDEALRLKLIAENEKLRKQLKAQEELVTAFDAQGKMLSKEKLRLDEQLKSTVSSWREESKLKEQYMADVDSLRNQLKMLEQPGSPVVRSFITETLAVYKEALTSAKSALKSCRIEMDGTRFKKQVYSSDAVKEALALIKPLVK